MTTAVEPARAQEPFWRPMVAAIGKTASGSMASGLLSALATKVVASLLGPGSVALLQTLQQLRDGALAAATATGKTALVQGASAFEGSERREYLRRDHRTHQPEPRDNNRHQEDGRRLRQMTQREDGADHRKWRAQPVSQVSVEEWAEAGAERVPERDDRQIAP